MLRQLTIRDFAIVDALELDFAEGFTAVTGETGAGKSIMVGALAMLLGERASASSVRDGAERAELIAEFDVTAHPSASQWLNDEAMDANGDCLLRRVITAAGRSRAWINGTPVTVAQLQSLGEHLVELHGQNQHLKLGERPEQLSMLDTGDDATDAAEAVAQSFEQWLDAKHALDALTATDDDGADLDYLAFQRAELEHIELEPDAIAALDEEHARLSRMGELQSAIAAGTAALDGDDGADRRLGEAMQALQPVGELASAVAEALRLVEEARINAREASASLSAALSDGDEDPRRLDELEQRIQRLHDLSRKHRVRPEELAAVRDQLSERIDKLTDIDRLRAEAETTVETRLAQYRAVAEELHAERTARAKTLQTRVNEMLAELGMTGDGFEIRVERDAQRRPSRRGDDRVQFNISANPGTPPAPLSQVASGGELSRISLALRVAAAGSSQGRIQVFDEVDAGIGGDTANAVGRLLATLADGGQAVAVTHLAQVAACAHQQVRVDKLAGDDTTRVSARRLDASDRVDEIARMLSGRISDQSRAHAAELLNEARDDAA